VVLVHRWYIAQPVASSADRLELGRVEPQHDSMELHFGLAIRSEFLRRNRLRDDDFECREPALEGRGYTGDRPRDMGRSAVIRTPVPERVSRASAAVDMRAAEPDRQLVGRYD
jgi:hypothetical protein